MAVAARSGQSSARAGRSTKSADARAMVKRTAPTPVPRLAVVPRRRRAARLVTAISVVVVGLMLGAAAFQTQIARRQMSLDQLDRALSEGRDRYERLRQERSELRSPGRLMQEAAAIGMEPASQTEFVTVSPDDVAIVQRTGAVETARPQTEIEEQFEQYADFKAQAQAGP